MGERNDSIGAKVMRGIVAGGVAGIVASFAMDRFQAAVAALSPDRDDGSEAEPATAKAADAVTERLLGHPVAAADKPLGGQAVHYALGLGLGIAYGIAAEFRPVVTAGHGAAFAVGTATLLDEGAVPAVGLGEPPWKASLASNIYSYASHLAFGGTAEFVRRRVAISLIPDDGDQS